MQGASSVSWRTNSRTSKALLFQGPPLHLIMRHEALKGEEQLHDYLLQPRRKLLGPKRFASPRLLAFR